MTERPPPDIASALAIVEAHLLDAPIDVRVAWHRVRSAAGGRPRRTTQPFERVEPKRVRVFPPPIPREEPDE